MTHLAGCSMPLPEPAGAMELPALGIGRPSPGPGKPEEALPQPTGPWFPSMQLLREETQSHPQSWKRPRFKPWLGPGWSGRARPRRTHADCSLFKTKQGRREPHKLPPDVTSSWEGSKGFLRRRQGRGRGAQGGRAAQSAPPHQGPSQAPQQQEGMKLDLASNNSTSALLS